MAQANMQPKRITEYPLTTNPDGTEVLLFAKNGTNGTIKTQDLPISTPAQAVLATKTNDSSLAPVAKSGNYTDLTNKPTIPTVPVQSVNGKTGAVVVTQSDVGLGNVTNTSDANKPVSTAQQSALDAKLNAINSVSTQNANFTAAANIKYSVDATSGSVIATLPATNTKRDVIIVSKSDSTINTVTISGSINGTAGSSLVLRTSLQHKLLQGDGAGNWNVIAGDLNLVALDARYMATGTAIPESQVTNLVSDLAAKAPLASPALTGTPTAPTAAVNTNSTQLATTSYVVTAIANLVASAPTTLDTLNEIAAALGNDPNFATTITTALGNRVQIGGDISGTPTAPTVSFANDTLHVLRAGDTMTGDLTLSAGQIYLATAKALFLQGTSPNWKLGRNIYAPTVNNTISFNRTQIVFTTNAAEGFQLISTGNGGTALFETGSPSGVNNFQTYIHTPLIVDGSITPNASATLSIGSSTLFFSNLYATRHYFNSTAYLDGANAGTVALSGKLGIGISNPAYSFEVAGGARFGSDIRQYGSTVIRQEDNALYLQTDSANDIIFRTNGTTERARVNTSGIVLPQSNSLFTGNSQYSATAIVLDNVIHANSSRTSRIDMGNKENTGLGGARFTWYADADNNVVGTKMLSLYGYPLKTFDGSTAGFEQLMNFQFTSYTENVTDGTGISYGKVARIFAQLQMSGDITANANNSRSLGSSALYWLNTFSSRLYVNTTAYIDGATVGQLNVTGEMAVNGNQYTVHRDGSNYHLYSTNLANTIAFGAIQYDATANAYGIIGIGRNAKLGTNSGGIIFTTGTGTETEAMRITNTGNIGIFNTAPSFGYDQKGGGMIIRTIGAISGGVGTPVGTAGSTTYNYYIVGIDRAGRRGGIAGPLVVSTGNATLSATNYNALTWTNEPRYLSYEILKGDTNTLLGTSTTASFNDTGQATTTYTNRKYHDQTGDLTVNGQMVVGNTAIPSDVSRLVVGDADATILLTNNGENPAGFMLQSYATTQFGLHNFSGTATGIIGANTKRSLFGFDSTGKVGSLTNSIGSAVNAQGTTGTPVFRNLIDDGSGNTLTVGNIYMAGGKSIYFNGSADSSWRIGKGIANYTRNTTTGIDVILGSGAADGISFGITAGNSMMELQSATGSMFIRNAVAAPTTNPTAGGYLYVEGGALKYRGSSGTVTVVGIA